MKQHSNLFLKFLFFFILLLSARNLMAQQAVQEDLEEKSHKHYGYDSGFYVETEDGNNRLRFQGLIMPRFTYNFLEAQSDNMTFSIQEGLIRFNGHVFRPTLKYGFEMNIATRNAATTTTVCTNPGCTSTANAVTSESTSGIATLNDFFIDWLPIDEFGIQFGQYKVPFLIQELTFSGRLEFPERSLANGLFSLTRDIGIAFHGRVFDKHMGYAIYLMNGDGANNLSANKMPMAGLRLEWNILGTYTQSESDVEFSETPNLGVGLAYAYKQTTSAVEAGTIASGIKTSNGTLDAGFKYKGFSIQAVGMATRTHTGPSITNWGYNCQVGYFIIPKHFEIAGKAGGAILKGAPDQFEYALDLNYFINGHSLKLQTDYTLLMNNRGQDLNDHRVRVQAVALF